MSSRIVRPDTAFPLSNGPKKRPRNEDKRHLDFIRGLPCLLCGARSEAAHVRYAGSYYGKGETGVGRKPDDRWVVPLCSEHHRTGPDAQHGTSEKNWWKKMGVNPLIAAALLYSASSVDDEEAAKMICQLEWVHD